MKCHFEIFVEEIMLDYVQKSSANVDVRAKKERCSRGSVVA